MTDKIRNRRTQHVEVKKIKKGYLLRHTISLPNGKDITNEFYHPTPPNLSITPPTEGQPT